MTDVMSRFIELKNLFHIVNNQRFLSPNLRDPESKQRQFLFDALELEDNESDTNIKEAIVDIFYLIRSLTVQRHMRFKQLKDESVKDYFSYDLSKIDEYMYRIVEKSDTKPNMYLFLQYTLALLEICKQSQLSKIYPYKESGNTVPPKIIDFIDNLVLKDTEFTQVKKPSMYVSYKKSLPSPIQFESYMEQRESLGDNMQLKQKLSVFYFIMMMSSMAFIPDPDYMKLVFGESNYTHMTKQALDKLGYCGIPSQIKQYQKLVRSIIAKQILDSTETAIPNFWNQEVNEYGDWFKDVSQKIYPLEGGVERQDPFAVYTVMRMYTTHIHLLNEHRNEATKKQFDALQHPWGFFYKKVIKKSEALKKAERELDEAKAKSKVAEAAVRDGAVTRKAAAAEAAATKATEEAEEAEAAKKAAEEAEAGKEIEYEYEKTSFREVLQASIHGKAFTEETFQQACNLWRLSLIQHYIAPVTYLFDKVGPYVKDVEMMNVDRAQYRLEKPFYQDVLSVGFDFLQDSNIYKLDRLLPMKIHENCFMTIESPKKRGMQSFGIQVKRERLQTIQTTFVDICKGFLRKYKDDLSDIEQIQLIRYIQSIKSLNSYLDSLSQDYVPYDIIVNAIGELITKIRKIRSEDYKHMTADLYNDLLKGIQPSNIRTLLLGDDVSDQQYLVINFLLMPHYKMYNEEKSLPGELDERIVRDDICHSPSIVFMQEYAITPVFVSLHRDVLMAIPKSVVKLISDPSVKSYVNFGVWFNHMIHKVMKNRIKTSDSDDNPILPLEQVGGDRSGEVVYWTQDKMKINLNSVKQFNKDGFSSIKQIMEDEFLTSISRQVDVGDEEKVLIQKMKSDSDEGITLTESEKMTLYRINQQIIRYLKELKQEADANMKTRDWVQELVPTLIPSGSIRENV